MQTVSMGYDYVLAVQEDGSLWGWGNNEYGQLGVGDDKDRFSPVKIMDGVESVCAGYNNSFAIREDGSLWGWGFSLPFGKQTNRGLIPIHLMDDVLSCEFKGGNGFIIKKDHTLWTWGYISPEQYGAGMKEDVCSLNPRVKFCDTPIQIMEEVETVKTRDYKNIALKKDGSVWIWGDEFHVEKKEELLALNPHYYYRNDDFPEDFPFATLPSPFKMLEDAVSVDIPESYSDEFGIHHMMALKKDGSVWCWGDNLTGQLGMGDNEDYNYPVSPMTRATSIYAGPGYSAVIQSDDSLWMWGDNTFGQLGNGEKGEEVGSLQVHDIENFCCSTPSKVLDKVASVTTNAIHVLALQFDGSLWGWGSNEYGQLGIGIEENQVTEPNGFICQTTPIKIMENVAFALSRGQYIMTDPNTVVVQSDGSLWTCGRNLRGQIGREEVDCPEKNCQQKFVKIMDRIKIPKE